ncbi:MAG TPA: substrate-binding domain-containing protein [Flavobacterium sp.]|jgi:ABC-type nitrate/sulfonate/bicarbonate transport system substrate-binding protein
MKKFKLVGVPEHFNYPWHLCFQAGEFQSAGIDLHWQDVPEGTGKMCEMLRSGEADIAVILTEGIVRDIINGNKSSIVQVYVESPLIWGIHVSAGSKFQHLADLKDAKVAISRPGSGSQLMAYVNAANQGWPPEELEFVTVNTIDGAVEALSNGQAEYFMWERFMTQPLVDKGIFRRIADCPTPWPCFVIAVRNEVIETCTLEIKNVLRIINDKTRRFKEIPNISFTLADKFNQRQEDISEWLTLTSWSEKQLTDDMLNKVQNELVNLRLIDKKATFTQIVKDV